VSQLAHSILYGEEAFLVCAQAHSIGRTETHEVYLLRTAAPRVAIWDAETRSLVVFDTPALIALANQEAIDARKHQQHHQRHHAR